MASNPAKLTNEVLRKKFNSFRKQYYIQQGLKMPSNVDVRFIPVSKWDERLVPEDGETCKDDGYVMRRDMPIASEWELYLQPRLANVRIASEIVLLHLMARIGVRINVAGKERITRKQHLAEIDRLYELGAYKRLI